MTVLILLLCYITCVYNNNDCNINIVHAIASRCATVSYGDRNPTKHSICCRKHNEPGWKNLATNNSITLIVNIAIFNTRYI